jgi:thiamine-monophosphate kinase
MALSEVELIKHFQKLARPTRTRYGRVLQSIGDDTAVVHPPRGPVLFASDMLVEGVHFTRAMAPRWIGWKALAVNLSDIAAMGGEPIAAVVSLGLPQLTPRAWVHALYAGLTACARTYHTAVVGGDTVRANGVVVDVAVLGCVPRGKPILRRGARVGDVVYVTGALGGSLKSGRHARFRPRLAEARALRRWAIHCMVDLSDGLAVGLNLLAEAGRRRLIIDPDRLPRHRGVGLAQAWFDGEDFELAFTVSADTARRLPQQIGSTPLHAIGWVAPGRAGVYQLPLKGHAAMECVPARGFAHFAGAEEDAAD